MSTGSNSQEQLKPEAGQAPAPAKRAFRSVAAMLIFLVIASLGTAGDLLSKHFVFDSFLSDPDLPQTIEKYRTAFWDKYHEDPPAHMLLATQQRQVCPGVRFTLSANPGIVFGLPMARWSVNIATMAAIVLVLVFFVISDSRARMLHAALAMILAGAIGNLYDRMFSNIELPGVDPIRYHVRDFIDCSQLHYVWIFNIADVLLVAGVATLFLHSILSTKKTAGKTCCKTGN